MTEHHVLCDYSVNHSAEVSEVRSAGWNQSHANGKRLLDAMAEDYLERERPLRRVFPWAQVGVAAFLVAVAFIGARMVLWGLE